MLHMLVNVGSLACCFESTCWASLSGIVKMTYLLWYVVAIFRGTTQLLKQYLLIWLTGYESGKRRCTSSGYAWRCWSASRVRWVPYSLSPAYAIVISLYLAILLDRRYVPPYPRPILLLSFQIIGTYFFGNSIKLDRDIQITYNNIWSVKKNC